MKDTNKKTKNELFTASDKWIEEKGLRIMNESL